MSDLDRVKAKLLTSSLADKRFHEVKSGLAIKPQTAEMFDCFGFIAITSLAGGNSYSLRVVLSQAYPTPYLDELLKTFGGQLYKDKRVWRWSLTGQKAYSFLKVAIGMLHKMKAPAQLAMEFQRIYVGRRELRTRWESPRLVQPEVRELSKEYQRQLAEFMKAKKQESKF